MAELNMKVTGRTLIKASDDSKKPYTLPPSNFDTFPGPFPAWVHYIYPKPAGGGGFPAVVSLAKKTLPELLNYYFPFAGRIVVNPSTGGFEILCNNGGAELVEAVADVPLAAVNFSDLTKSLDRIFLSFAPDLCLSVQLASYTCGGFSLVFASNHLMIDAYALLNLARSWADIARAGEPTVIPNHDRGMIKPRSPLSYSPTIENKYRAITLDDMVNVLSSDVFVRRLYTVEVADLDRLRTDAAAEDGRAATRTEAFSAYVWKALARAVGDADANCQMGWLVDGRSRMTGELKPLMPNYVGNFISLASGEAPVKDITDGSLAGVANLVGKSISDIANEDHFLDLNDWFEANKTSIRITRVQLGLGSPSVVVSSTHNLRVNMDFGFGQPGLALPQISWGRLASSFMLVARNPKNDGSWTVIAYVWPKLAAEFESDPRRLLRPAMPEHFGFFDHTVHVEFLSRL